MALTVEELRSGLARWAPKLGADWAAGWHASVTGEGRLVCDEGGRVVARVLGGDDWRQQDAFLDLLAASPARATALQALGAAVDAAYLPGAVPAEIRAALVGARTALDEAGVPALF